jgi:hypothetical protein
MFNFFGYKRDANQNYTKISSHFLPLNMNIYIQQQTTNAGKDAVKQEPLYAVGGKAH